MKVMPALLALLALTFPAQAETLHKIGHSPISKVIAYQGQGIVTREVRLNLNQPGDHQLRITDIPLGIVADSLHVSGEGQAAVLIHNVQLLPLPPGSESEQVRQLQTRLQELSARLARLENVEQTNTRAQEWLDAYWEREEAENSRSRPEDWQKTLDFLSQNQARIAESVTRTRLEQEKLEAQQQQLESELEQLQADEALKTQAAAIYFSAKSRGEMVFRLRYLVPQIRWTPSYDARLDEKGDKISLTYYGDLAQQTGENWKDVELSLSTAVPQLNAAVPVLSPWIMTDQLPDLSAVPTDARVPKTSSEEGPAGELEDRDRSDTAAGFAESEVETQGLSVLFTIPQKVSVESAPHPRRVAIATRSFKYEPEYQVVPKLSPRVYLRARFRNTDNLPLLAGQIRNYVGQDYTGTSQLALVRPNEEASLNFGVDENIRVTRKEGLEKTTLEGLMRDIRRRQMSYEIEVSNFKSHPVKVVVWDHLPLVRNEGIKLDVLGLQPAPAERNRDNLLRWNLELKPQEKRRISVTYAVEHPAALEVYTNFSNQPARRNQAQEYEKF